MYFYIGHDKVIYGDGILGIFDMDNISQSKRTRNFLNASEKKGQISVVGTDLPKTIILYDGRGKSEVILAQTAASTITKRAQKNIIQ